MIVDQTFWQQPKQASLAPENFNRNLGPPYRTTRERVTVPKASGAPKTGEDRGNARLLTGTENTAARISVAAITSILHAYLRGGARHGLLHQVH